MRGPHHAPRFAQHQFDEPGILLHGSRQFERSGTRHDVGQIDAPALGLGDHFLREHQHIVGAQREPGARQRVRGQGGEIVAGRHLRKFRQCDEPQLDRRAHRNDPTRAQPNAARSRGKT